MRDSGPRQGRQGSSRRGPGRSTQAKNRPISNYIFDDGGASKWTLGA